MMKATIFKISAFLLLFSLLSLFILSCQKDKIEYSLPTPEGLIQWDILKVEGENSVNVNDTLRLDVYCPRTSCDYISFLLSDDYGNRIFVKAFGNTFTQTFLACMDETPQVIQYEFVPKKKGVYTLEFIKSDQTIIKFTVNSK